MPERQKRQIDKTSYIVALDDRSSQRIIVFVHGIFGRAEETWGDTPSIMMTSPAFATFDYASFAYTSNVIDRRRPNLAVDMLIPWVEANLQQYRNIYFIAHSMSGLLIREAVVSLLTDARRQDLLTRIRSCFLVASPIAGAKLAKVLKAIRLNWVNRRVGYLANPTINGEDMSTAYIRAATAFINRGGSKMSVPRFFYFVGEKDSLVTEPQRHFYTEYDSYAGVYPGSHASIKPSFEPLK